MIDLYSSFAHLETHESHGTDFRVRAIERPASPALILAPHGGGIEIGTSQLAARIARGVHSLFSFEGLKPAWQNRGLHITSHNFDHPLCLAMLARSPVTVAIHGCKGESQIYLGGLDEELKLLLAARDLVRRGFLLRRKVTGIWGGIRSTSATGGAGARRANRVHAGFP